MTDDARRRAEIIKAIDECLNAPAIKTRADLADAIMPILAVARREERERWLDQTAKIEGEIAADVRYTKQEVMGAHYLGSALRATEPD